MRIWPLALLLSLVVACSSSPAADDTGTTDDDITDLPQTETEDQKTTGNCWLYSTTSWAESLAAPTGGTAPWYSTSYLVYWNFYDQILASGTGFTGVEWTGGSWEEAVAIIKRYGLVPYSAVTTKTTVGADATLSLAALAAVNKALESGTLVSKAARKDAATVRLALNQAFALSPSLIGDLDTSFGTDGKTTFAKGAVATGALLDPSTIPARVPAGTSDLATVIGTFKSSELDPSTAASKRDAAFTTFVRRIQRSLQAKIPVPVEWCVEYTGENNDDVFDKAISGVQEADCAHQTVIVDYEVTLADGTVLKAGEPATAAQMTAALDPAATVTFLRMKNSWGKDAGATSDAAQGFTDVYVDYLKSSIESCSGKTVTSSCEDWPFLLYSVVLPPGY